MLPDLLNHGQNIEFEIPWVLKLNNFRHLKFILSQEWIY